MTRLTRVPARLAALVSALAGLFLGWAGHAAPSPVPQRGVWWEPNVPYDGRFTFARIRYTVYGRSGWEYDYPRMERHFMTMLREITTLRPVVDGSNIHTFDDPELLRYPIAYLSEPGFWIPSDSECAGLRRYLEKGGFLIVDDFYGGQWYNFERQILRALPGAQIEPLDDSHPIFDSFFRVADPQMWHPADRRAVAQWLGIYEDNDPTKRLRVVINYNNDVGDYMEWSDEDIWPVNISNDAYKIAINWIVYGMMH
jgi:hypothetical protein